MDQEFRYFFYAVVILHELCHHYRLKRANFLFSKVTPDEMANESGNRFEFEAFGRIINVDDASKKAAESFMESLNAKAMNFRHFLCSNKERVIDEDLYLKLWKKSGLFGDYEDNIDGSSDNQHHLANEKQHSSNLYPLHKRESLDDKKCTRTG